MNKVVVAGSRSITDEDWVHRHITRILADTDQGEIVSGTCYGPDQFGESWAAANNWPVKQFPAQWDTLGRRAGYVRNKTMAQYGTHLIAFLAPESKGTQHMIDLAREFGLKIRIIRPPREDS